MFGFDETVIEKLKVRDKIFKTINKEVILVVINESTRPEERKGHEKLLELKKEQTQDLIFFVSSMIYPESTATMKKSYDEGMNLTEKQRIKEIKSASNILENLSHGERLQYFETASSKGFVHANGDWEHRKIKWRVVRDI